MSYRIITQEEYNYNLTRTSLSRKQHACIWDCHYWLSSYKLMGKKIIVKNPQILLNQHSPCSNVEIMLDNHIFSVCSFFITEDLEKDNTEKTILSLNLFKKPIIKLKIN